jgi:hypothetical protein
VVVEGGVVDLGQGEAVGEHRLAEELIGIGHDVGRVQQVVVGRVADRPGVVVVGEDPLSRNGACA